MAFCVAFILGLLIATECNISSAAETTMVRFKRGTTSHIIKKLTSATDEEKPSRQSTSRVDDLAKVESRKALARHPAMIDVFSWQNLNYTVPISGEAPRKLLDNIFGYVAPGKLTALMGASGMFCH